MNKEYTSLGLMSGTSGDGVDASIIRSDGRLKYEVIKEKYFEYDNKIYQKIHKLKQNIINLQDLKKNDRQLSDLEREITLFHAKVVKELINEQSVDLVGFHGQTIYHNPQEKISNQLGDGRLLSQLSKKSIVYNFRQNDIKNEGEGAPLAPIFHKLLTSQLRLDLPICILNIGGISNITFIEKEAGISGLTSRDIGPGNCLIDSWVRQNSDKKFDSNGLLASLGNVNDIILEQAQELFLNRPNQNTLSLDVSDFDVSFARGLSLEDGATTLTDFTARVIGSSLSSFLLNVTNNLCKVLVCGGGRKNKILMDKIKKNLLNNVVIQPIDDYGVNGDFIESQAFAFLAIRSKLKLPITFPNTTGCKQPSTGGILIEY